MRRKIVALLVIGCVALCAAPAGAVEGEGKDSPLSAGAYIRGVGGLRVGDAVPRFRAKDIYGVEICLEDMIKAGKKPLLAFWSMYCQACVEKFNAMVTVQKKYADRGLAVISVNTDGEYRKGEAAIREFIAVYEKKHGFKINFPVLYDDRNWLPQTMGIEFLPTIIAVDPGERVAGYYQKFDETTEADIIAGIEAMAEHLLKVSAASPAPAAPAPPRQ
jgi:peroxiredoxin